jgi:hypothetical protein
MGESPFILPEAPHFLAIDDDDSNEKMRGCLLI